MKLHSKEILNFALFDLSNLSFIVPTEKPSLQKDNIFNGLVPNHLSLLRFNVSSLCITVSVNPRLSNQLNSSEKDTNLYPSIVYTLFPVLHVKYITMLQWHITQEVPKRTCSVYAFDLTPGMCRSSSNFKECVSTVMHCASKSIQRPF